MRQIVGILGVPVDVLDHAAVLARLEQFIDERRFHQVATANTDFLINAIGDPELRNILRNADLVVPDGMPLVWAARLMRTPLPERVTGSEIVPSLAAMSAEKGYRIFLLGAAPDVAKAAQENLESEYPGVRIVGRLSPDDVSLVETENEAILAEIQHARPDVLLVAFGNPKQEKWIHVHREALRDVPVCIGVGGTFDFLAGEIARAPRLMQRTGFEWLFRLSQEPRRLWRRYSRDLREFLRFAFWQCLTLRRQRDSRFAQVYAVESGECTVVSVVGALKGEAVLRFRASVSEAIEAERNVILDLYGVTAIDAATLGVLLNLPKRAAYRQRAIRLVGASRSIERALRRGLLREEPFLVASSFAHALAGFESSERLLPRAGTGMSAN